MHQLAKSKVWTKGATIARTTGPLQNEPSGAIVVIVELGDDTLNFRGLC
jgi:hypothetical protein